MENQKGKLYSNNIFSNLFFGYVFKVLYKGNKKIYTN